MANTNRFPPTSAEILNTSGDPITLPASTQLPSALAAGGGLKVEGVAGGVAQPVTQAQAASSTHTAVSAAGAACTLTLAAVAAQKHRLGHVIAGYDDTPPAGAKLTITDNGTTVFQIPITTSGPAPIPVNIQSAAVNTAMVITLSAGGGAILAYVNCPDAVTEA